MAIGYSLRMCAWHVDSTNSGRRNLVFRSKPILEAEMSNRLINNLALTVGLSASTYYVLWCKFYKINNNNGITHRECLQSMLKQ